MPAKAIRPPVLVALAILAMVSPIATDMYLPGFPQIEADLNTSPGTVQLTLSSFMIGMAAGQLFWGPLSDRIGRRGPLIVASLLFVLSSGLAATSTSVWMLLIMRLIQGFTGSAGVVIGRAVARDLATGAELATAFSLMGVVMSLAPVLAPVLGGVLIGTIGWRGVLWAIFGIAVVMALAVIFVVPESRHPQASSGGSSGQLARNIRTVLTDVPFLGYTASAIFGFGAVFTFISSSSDIYQVVYGLTSTQYALLFAVNAAGMAIVGLVSSRLISHVSQTLLLRIALSALLLGSAVLALASISGGMVPLWLIVVFVFVATCMSPVLMATTSTLGLLRHGEAAGMAAAVMGALQFVVAGIVSPMVTITGEVSVTSMAVVMLISATLAISAGFLYRRAKPVDGFR